MTFSQICIREFFPHLKLEDKNLSFVQKLYIYTSMVTQLYVIMWICLYFLLPYISENTYKNADNLHLGKIEYDEVLDSLLKEYDITTIKEENKKNVGLN